MQANIQLDNGGLVFGAEDFIPNPFLNQLFDLMQKTIFFAGLLFFSSSIFGQSTFHKRFQGGGFFSISSLSNGGVLGSGYQNQFFDSDQGLLVRFSQEGEVIWRKRFPPFNFIRYSVETSSGFVIVGDTVPYGGAHPRPQFAIVSKLSDNGTVIWSKITGDPVSQTIFNRAIVAPNGYILSGQITQTTKTRSFFSSIDEAGNTRWSKTYFANLPNHFNSFSGQLIEGDTLYACGNIQGSGCFVRININTGEIIGLSSIGGIYQDLFSSLKPTQDGNFILAGFTRSTTGSEESRPWVVKVNRVGQIIWSKTYNLLGTSLICKMTEANDGGFVLSMGGDNSFTTSYAVLAKIDSSGNILWAYNYSGGEESGFGEIEKASIDDGFIALGGGTMLKTDKLGRVSNGCCPAPIIFQVEDYSPPLQNPILISEDRESMQPFAMYAVDDSSFSEQDFCETPITSIVEQVQVCEGDSILINESFFHAPNTVRDTILSLTGGCDTIRVYNLLQTLKPTRVQFVFFCPGDSVVFNGHTYTQPNAIFQIIPATVGCDTILETYINWKPLPKKYQTTTFCPGDTVFIDGVGYQFPGILPNPDTLPGLLNDCDTLLYQVLAYPSTPSAVSVSCPPNIELSTAPATPVVVNYALPTVTSDCTCPDLYISLVQGLPSGTAFPIGNTQVCFWASDICGDYETCCFDVNVKEEAACDLKEVGCIQYELLGISVDAEQNKTYRIRVTNDCTSPLSYTAFQVPNGVEALAPAQTSTYFSPNGNEYAVRNPNHSPFRSVRFKPVSNGVSGGESDIFEYTLPAQSNPTFIKATTRLASGALYEATLNTFDCVVQAERLADRTEQSTVVQSLRVFPNPNSGELFVDFSGWVTGSAQLRILNLQGQELVQKLLPITSGVQSLSIPRTLLNGFYFLEIRSESGERRVAKFMLRR